MKKILGAAVVCALLAGCGGGGSSVTPSASMSSATTAQVALSFTFNATHGLAARRHANYISQNTKGLGVYVKATGTGSFPATTAAMRNTTWATTIAPGFVGQGATCTGTPPNNGGASYQCTIVLTAPVGYDDFQITTWDAAPISQGFGGTFAATANNLSFNNITDQLVELNSKNTFNYTLDGIVSSVALFVTPNSLVDGAATGSSVNPTVPTLYVRALDADGNTIIGTAPYVDANGNPLTITVTAVPSYPATPPPTGGAPGTVTLGQTTFTSPASPSTTISYDGGDILSAALNVSTSSPALITSADIVDATLGFTRTDPGTVNVPGPPAITEYAFSPSGAQPYRAALGPDGRVWFANGAVSLIGAVSTAGTVTTYPVNSPQSNLVAGPDGDVWFTEDNGDAARINTDGTGYVEFALASIGDAVTVGPDNDIYVAETNGDVAKFGWVGGVPTLLTQFFVGGVLSEITSGPNGHLWALDRSTSSVHEVTTTGSVVNTYTYAAGVGHVLQGMTIGQDGNIWFGDYTAGTIVRMTPGGTFTPYVVGGNTQQITVGPDGNIWACTDGINQIVRIDTSTGVIQKYTTGFTPGALTGIATGSDGNLWLLEYSGNRVAKLTP